MIVAKRNRGDTLGQAKHSGGEALAGFKAIDVGLKPLNCAEGQGKTR